MITLRFSIDCTGLFLVSRFIVGSECSPMTITPFSNWFFRSKNDWSSGVFFMDEADLLLGKRIKAIQMNR